MGHRRQSLSPKGPREVPEMHPRQGCWLRLILTEDQQQRVAEAVIAVETLLKSDPPLHDEVGISSYVKVI